MAGRRLSDATPISLTSPLFWTRLNEASSHQNVGFFKTTPPNGGPLYIVNMNHNIKMVPFVRTREELFSSTAKRESQLNSFKVVINGPTYGLTKTGIADALWGSDPVPASESLQEGRVILNGKLIGGSKSDMYFVRNDRNGTIKYRFGRGSAPLDADAALGNMGPLVVNKLPFGAYNNYSPPQPAAPKTGEPGKAHKPLLTQRSNSRFTHMAGKPDSVGKIVIGYRADKAQLLIMLQPDGSIGTSISSLRSVCVELGLDSAVYLDGSDSVMLMLNHDFVISQGEDKNETTITGIGFAY